MPALIIIDEWLLNDLYGNNDDNQEKALRFIVRLAKTSDKIIILHNSPFEAKMFRFIKMSENNNLLNSLSKLFHNSIVRNSSKTLFLNEEDLKPISPKLLKLIPEDDVYLFQAHLSVKDSFILTSDERWPQKLIQHKSVKVLMRDAFLKKYLKV